MIRAAVALGVLVGAACDDPCLPAPLDCDEGCPTLAEVDPRVTGGGPPCRVVTECTDLLGQRYTRITWIDDPELTDQVFDDRGKLVEVVRWSDELVDGCLASKQGVDVQCTSEEVRFESCPWR